MPWASCFTLTTVQSRARSSWHCEGGVHRPLTFFTHQPRSADETQPRGSKIPQCAPARERCSATQRRYSSLRFVRRSARRHELHIDKSRVERASLRVAVKILCGASRRVKPAYSDTRATISGTRRLRSPLSPTGRSPGNTGCLQRDGTQWIPTTTWRLRSPLSPWGRSPGNTGWGGGDDWTVVPATDAKMTA